MATTPAARNRRQRDRSLGQIPLSSSEIELYSRQDEATRRQRRLLAVRDEERRLAQQMTQRYRNNLQKLQHKKLHTFQKELSIEQQRMLKEMHTQYQNSLQSKGTEQRNARLKLLEFMEQAQKEKKKRTFKCQIAENERTIEAQEGQEKEEVVVGSRRRQMEQKRERLNVVSNQQQGGASARGQQEKDVAIDQNRDREELEMLRRMQSSEEVVATPRRRQKDGVSYRVTRTPCGSIKTSGMERPAVTVIHNDKNSLTAMRGKDDAMKARDEINHKRERDRFIVEAQQKKRLERGEKALDEVVLRRQGLQAMEWLALVDKMERRARGLGGGEDYSLHAGDVDGGIEKSERMAEQAFAQMLGLGDDSIELSVFSMNSDDDRSVTFADPDHELVDGDEAARVESGCRVKLKGTKCSGSVDLRDRSESVGPVTSCKGEQAEHRPGKPLKTTMFGGLQREELDKLQKPEDMRRTGLRLEGVRAPSKARSEARNSEYEYELNMSTRLSDGFHEQTCSRVSHSSIVATDDEDTNSNSETRLQDVGDGPPKSDSSAGCSSGPPSKASSTENVQSKDHSENRCSEVMAVECDGSLRSVFVSENGKESAELNTGQLGENCGVGDRALLETPCLQREWCTTSGDKYIFGAAGHRDKYGNTEEQSEGTNEVGENRSARDRLNLSPQSLARDEVNEKNVLEDTLDLGRQISTTGPVDASFVEGAEFLSASLSSTSDASNHESYKKGHDFDRQSYRNVAIDEDERLSLSDSFSAPSQKSLSHLDLVANNRARSLKQLFVDQQMMSFSDSEGLSEDEREGEAESHRPAIGINSARSSVNFSPRDPYCQQMHYKARRSSTSAVSVAQYSLPSSDTQNSFDESLEGLYLGHDDSFVNELVPMFPKHTLPPPPQSLEEDNQLFEEHDIQRVAPNMSRMLTSERLPSISRSEQRLIHEKHQAAASDHRRRQPPASTTVKTEGKRPSTSSDKCALSSSSSRWSCSDSSSCKLDGKSFNTSVEQSPVKQHKGTGQIRQVTTVAAGSKSRKLSGNSQPPTGDCKERDVLSDISSESGFSSLGWSVELSVAAGPTRRGDTGDGGRVITNSVDSQHDHHAQEFSSDDEGDRQSIASVRSFASSSSMSMDAYFNYIINLTSTVSLPLPTMMYGKKDMTKLPAPTTWSTSSVSSVTIASKVDQSDDSETSSLTAGKSVASSDPNDSLLEMQHVHPRRSGKIDHLARDRDLQHFSPVSYQSEESDASRTSERMRGTRSGKGPRCTCTGNGGEITELRLSSLSSRNMSQPPTPMPNFGWSLEDSGSSDGQSTDYSQQRHFLGPINTHQPAAPMQRFSQSLDDSQSSSEQNFRDRSFQTRGVRRRSHYHSYDAEEESKQDDSSSESNVSSHSNASCGSSAARSCRQSMQNA